MTILENNCMQSIATAAGYMTGPLISGMAAYMMVENRPLPWWQMLWFNVVLSLLGVLVAFPMKRRFINDEQQPFPEGRACGVVLDTLYTSHASVGLFKAKALGCAALIAGGLKFISGENIMSFLQERVLGLKTSWHLPENLDAWYYALADQGHGCRFRRLAGVDIRQLGPHRHDRPGDVRRRRPDGDPRRAQHAGRHAPQLLRHRPVDDLDRRDPAAAPTERFSRIHVLNTWALWWGISIMVVAALASLVRQAEGDRERLHAASSGRRRAGRGRRAPTSSCRSGSRSSGCPIIGAIGVWMTHAWFGVRMGPRRAGDPADHPADPDRGELHRAHRHHADRIALEDPAVPLRHAAIPRHPPTNLMTALDVHRGRLQRLEPADGHQAGLHARRQAAPAGDRPLHRHLRRRARQHAALLPALPLGLPAGDEPAGGR